VAFSPREKVADRPDEGLVTSEIFENGTRDKALILSIFGENAYHSGTFPQGGRAKMARSDLKSDRAPHRGTANSDSPKQNGPPKRAVC
jgi:hypothetical protein